MAVSRANILHLSGFDSIRILFVRGEIFQNTGNAAGNPTGRILVCEVLACRRPCPRLEGDMPAGVSLHFRVCTQA